MGEVVEVPLVGGLLHAASGLTHSAVGIARTQERRTTAPWSLGRVGRGRERRAARRQGLRCGPLDARSRAGMAADEVCRMHSLYRNDAPHLSDPAILEKASASRLSRRDGARVFPAAAASQTLGPPASALLGIALIARRHAQRTTDAVELCLGHAAALPERAAPLLSAGARAATVGTCPRHARALLERAAPLLVAGRRSPAARGRGQALCGSLAAETVAYAFRGLLAAGVRSGHTKVRATAGVQVVVAALLAGGLVAAPFDTAQLGLCAAVRGACATLHARQGPAGSFLRTSCCRGAACLGRHAQLLGRVEATQPTARTKYRLRAPFSGRLAVIVAR